jgi:hypothetical protein
VCRYSPLPPANPDAPRGTAYLICLERPLRHARHYLGFSEGEHLAQRLDRHERGAGSALLRAARAQGISWQCVRVWENVTRREERWLKNAGSAVRLCPRCFDPHATRQRTLAGDISRMPA